MTHHTHICTCTHGELAHRYLLIPRTNGGECLAPNCWCDKFEEPAK